MRPLAHLIFILLGIAACATGCQKKPVAENAAATASAEQSSATEAAPTGIVKNAIRHTEETADVTKWMEMASNKTPAQLAEEARLAKIAKEAKDTKAEQDAKLAADAKVQASKAAATSSAAHEPVKPPVVTVLPTPAAVIATQTVAVAPTLPAVVPSKPVSVPVTAAATATAQDNAEQNQPRLVSSIQPTFPVTATLAGVTEGTVTARLTIGVDGKVSQVDIVKARPTKLFDKEVIAAASQWKYAPLASPQTKMVDFNFQSALKLLSSVQPTFPAAAAQAGVTEGTVSARINIGTDGKVTQVEIIKSKPAKLFDKEVIAAASQWKYAPVSSPQTKILEFNLKQ